MLTPVAAHADVPPGVLPPGVDTGYSLFGCYSQGFGPWQLFNQDCYQVYVDGAGAFWQFLAPPPVY
jgi:hypothetical protein